MAIQKRAVSLLGGVWGLGLVIDRRSWTGLVLVRVVSSGRASCAVKYVTAAQDFLLNGNNDNFYVRLELRDLIQKPSLIIPA